MLANRTRERLTISILPDGTVPQSFTMEIGESRPVFYQRVLGVRFGEGLVERTYQVAAKSAYFFTRGAGGTKPLRMEQIGFAHNKPAPSEVAARGNPLTPVIPVKILVDDDEPTHRQIWEANLRRRFAAAAEIIERHSGVKLSLVAVGMWDSDDRQHDFTASLTEFEQEVSPQPGQLAIGFSSQYNVQIGRVHMGGTRGALHPYILLKERSPNMLETQRVELLVHELGHYLGASHQSRGAKRDEAAADEQTFSAARVAHRLRPRQHAARGDGGRRTAQPRREAAGPSLATHAHSDGGNLRRADQGDCPRTPRQSNTCKCWPSPRRNPLPNPGPGRRSKPLRRFPCRFSMRRHWPTPTSRWRSFCKSSARRRPQPTADGRQPPDSKWYTGDKLTEFYVRQAALAVVQLEPQEMEKVFLLSLGVFLDDSGALLKFPATAGFVAKVEGDEQRDSRLQILGSPTMHDRHDLAQHFFVSAHLTAMLSPQLALSLGLAKEINDANGGTGFSFADLAADRAGIEFARRVAAGEISLEDLSQSFTVADYLPPIDGLPEGLSLDELKKQFGDTSSEAFQEQVKQIESAILALRVYQK